jgi:PPOX class probable F420-dependent enzyme
VADDADVAFVRRMVAADHGLAIVATTRADGSVHASLVNAGVLDDPVTGAPSVAMVVYGAAHKLTLLRRTRHATVTLRAGWRWASVDGTVRVIGPDVHVDGFADDQLPGLLRQVFTAAGGTHDNWAEYDRVMAQERRAAVLVSIDRVIGTR